MKMASSNLMLTCIIFLFVNEGLNVTAETGSGLVHHRSRRSINNQSSHNLLVYVTPYLNTSYYVRPYEIVQFEIRAALNKSGNDITNVTITLTSKWIDFSQGSQEQGHFSSSHYIGTENLVIFTLERLSTNSVPIGNVSGKIKPGIDPLSVVTVTFTANASSDGNKIYISDGVSAPALYGEFPEVNMTRGSQRALNVYENITMSLDIVVPPLDFSLLVELTTNIEDYIFMEIVDVNVTQTIDEKVPEKKFFSSQLNNEMDRVQLDFGNITGKTNEESRITIEFTVKINDHELLGNGSTHYFGVGFKAGESILWVEQYAVNIIKINQPSLNFTVVCENSTGLYIGDSVQFEYEVSHSSNSDAKADNMRLIVISDYLIPSTNQIGIQLNSFNKTHCEFGFLSNSSLNQGNVKRGIISMKVGSDISPLLQWNADVNLLYNKGHLEKRPIKKTIEGLTTGTPFIAYSLNGSDVVSPGQKMNFYLEIILTKMRSPLLLQLVMPKVDGKPLMSVLNLSVNSIGANIYNITKDFEPEYKNTTSETHMKDQVVLDLGVGFNNATSNLESAENKIRISFETIVNDHANVSNSSFYWVSAGILGKPKMVWVGQIKINTFIKEDARPSVDILISTDGGTEEFWYTIVVKHSEESSQFAYNVTFEYYLPPFLEFLSDNKSEDIEHVKGTKYKYKPEVLYFTQSFTHSIRVRINRDKSIQTGKFDYLTPVRVSMVNVHGRMWDYFRGISKEIEVLPRGPIIPKHVSAHKDYYGRGFYWKDENEFYVCMNQHVMTATSACYKLGPSKQYFTPLDRRIGCVLGSDDGLFGIGRNQKSFFKYENNNWYPIVSLPNSVFYYKDVSNATNFGVKNNDTCDDFCVERGGNKWIGTGDGLYYVSSGSWSIKAKWFL